MSPEKEEWTAVFVGSLDHPERVVLTEHIGVESQLPWYKVDDHLPHTRSQDDPELMELWADAGMTHEGKPL